MSQKKGRGAKVSLGAFLGVDWVDDVAGLPTAPKRSAEAAPVAYSRS